MSHELASTVCRETQETNKLVAVSRVWIDDRGARTVRSARFLMEGRRKHQESLYHRVCVREDDSCPNDRTRSGWWSRFRSIGDWVDCCEWRIWSNQRLRNAIRIIKTGARTHTTTPWTSKQERRSTQPTPAVPLRHVRRRRSRWKPCELSRTCGCVCRNHASVLMDRGTIGRIASFQDPVAAVVIEESNEKQTRFYSSYSGNVEL